MSDEEREGWRQYRLWIGFDIDRMERITSRAWGVEIPRIEPDTKRVKMAKLSAIQGVSVLTVPRKPAGGK